MSTQTPLPAATVLKGSLGSYTIQRVAGYGGFGIIYSATPSSSRFHGKVAVKEFFPRDLCGRGGARHNNDVIINSAADIAVVDELRRRFVEESRILSACRHPGIVEVYETIETNGTAYMVMEFIEGTPLSAIIENYTAHDSLLEVDAAEEIIRSVASALSHLHDNGIMHLDVKPGNIMITDDNRPILIDFGMSRRRGQLTPGGDSLTLCAVSKGYAAPEMYVDAENFSPAADIYSLGATFYRLLTGWTPPEPETLYRHPDTLRFDNDVPERHRTAIRTALGMPGYQRPDSMKQFIEILDFQKEPVSRKSDRFSKIVLNVMLVCIAIVAIYQIYYGFTEGENINRHIFPIETNNYIGFNAMAAFFACIGLYSRRQWLKTACATIAALGTAILFLNCF